MRRLEHKVALVTGASRGIGRGIALRLAAEGAKVVVNYHSNQNAANAVVAAIQAEGGTALAVQADIAQLTDIDTLFAQTISAFGKIDIVIANAGYGVFKPMLDTTEEDFDRTFATNAKGTFFCVQAALKHLSNNGRIVCISTIGTVLNLPGGACYFGSKAAIEQYCRVAAKEAAPRGITLNVVSPGFIAVSYTHLTLPTNREV